MMPLPSQFKVLGFELQRGVPLYYPSELLIPHEAQALRNHDQSLETLNDRGGLSPSEMLAVLTDRRWRVTFESIGKSEKAAWAELCRRLEDHKKKSNH